MARKVHTTVSATTGSRRVRVLFTCVGRRVELVRAFREAAADLGLKLEVHGGDASRLSPAMHRVDKPHVLPPISSDGYLDALLTLVRRARIDLLIPLIDLELLLVAGAADRLAKARCQALISSERVVRTCRDKLATFEALETAGIDTPRTWSWRDAIKKTRHKFPYFLKPRSGSAAMGNYVVHNRRELEVFGRRVHDPIVQEYVDGAEHTLDVYTGLDGKPRCVVPRKRLEVRSGEVSKGLIVKDPAIMAVGREVAEMLGECRGVITVQCIVTPGRRIRVIEINPRFGGGVPLAIHAGADFPRWILLELMGERPRINPTGFRNDIAMLRFDDSVFLRGASNLQRE
jgi:carbamoyl-phosphate synthase large subunit